MRITFRLALCLTICSLGAAGQAHAQGPLAPAARAFHFCTFNRACNWASHATIAFGLAYVLENMDVPPALAAGAAALFYAGREVRDHLRWGSFGSTDSNGDLLSAFAGALLAYYLATPSPPEPLARVGVELGAPTRITVQLEAP